jgi:hypothetical protein
MTTPAITLAGAIFKLRVVVSIVKQDHSDADGVVGYDEMDWDETGTLAVLADLERLAAGAS